MSVYDTITSQQKGCEGTDVWMVGQQLMDIIRGDKAAEQIVAEDMVGHSLKDVADALKKEADERRRQAGSRGGCVCIPPDEAEKVIRRFFGLPEQRSKPKEKPARAPHTRVRLEDYL